MLSYWIKKIDTVVRNSFVFNNTFDKTYYIILSFYILILLLSLGYNCFVIKILVYNLKEYLLEEKINKIYKYVIQFKNNLNLLKVKKIKVIVFKVILSRLLCCLLNLIYYLYTFFIFCKSFKFYILSLNFLENYVKYTFILIRASYFLMAASNLLS